VDDKNVTQDILYPY